MIGIGRAVAWPLYKFTPTKGGEARNSAKCKSLGFFNPSS
jgi:hypothetical protein